MNAIKEVLFWAMIVALWVAAYTSTHGKEDCQSGKSFNIQGEQFQCIRVQQ